MKVDDFLAHYASEYYDPVKAHEYYERTKHLKGRRSTSKLSSEGREIWNYTKNQILIQSGTAMLAQANAQPQAIVRLLQ